MQAGGRENRPGSAGAGGVQAGVRRAKDGGAVIPTRSAMQMLPPEGVSLAIGTALLGPKVMSMSPFTRAACSNGLVRKA